MTILVSETAYIGWGGKPVIRRNDLDGGFGPHVASSRGLQRMAVSENDPSIGTVNDPAR